MLEGTEEPQVGLRRELQRIYHGHGAYDSPTLMDRCSCAHKMREILERLAAGDNPCDDREWVPSRGDNDTKTA